VADAVDDPAPSDSFPRQWARTQRLTLGEPRTITVAADGSRVVFLRSPAGDDRQTALWVLDVATGEERLVAEPGALLSSPASAGAGETAEERARRERARESAGGVTTYATDARARVVAFALAGRLFVGGLVSGMARELAVEGPVHDPRPDPTCARVGYVCGRALRVAELDGSSRQVAGEDDPDVTWGQPEFVAAEEMDRSRGWWWSPDGARLAVARVDVGPVPRWHLADLAEPSNPATTLAYPAAGTDNALVTLHLVDVAGSAAPVEVRWDHEAFPYLADVTWPQGRPLTLTVVSRDQHRVAVLTADDAGATEVRDTEEDDRWVDLVAGVPSYLGDGRLVTAAERDGRRALLVDGEVVSPPGWAVRAVTTTTDDAVWFTATDVDEPTEQHLWSWSAAAAALTRHTHGPGVHSGLAGGDVAVVRSTSMDVDGAVVNVLRGGRLVAELASHAEAPLLRPAVTFARVGERRLASALLLPGGRVPEPGEHPLPVLLDPYGGPHAQRVVRSRAAFTSSQWLADQGFAVVVVDGRGTPGRGGEWERAVHLDLATPVLEDQVDALHALAEEHPFLDLDRVGIRGWSFGGYLAALAVLRRPDVFHAAVAGAPVTDWKLYDTFYTERYLGLPAEHPEAYRSCSLLEEAHRLERPLLLVHGLADDNVVAAHTLQLSSALLAAGRPHSVLPLSGVTHMTPQEVVAEHLLLLQVDFLRRHLTRESAPSAPS
jgi:dipeptidyl-peptidase-4